MGNPDVESKREDLVQVDAALQYLNHGEDLATMSEIDEKKLVRKIDWMIIPCERRLLHIIGLR